MRTVLWIAAIVNNKCLYNAHCFKRRVRSVAGCGPRFPKVSSFKIYGIKRDLFPGNMSKQHRRAISFRCQARACRTCFANEAASRLISTVTHRYMFSGRTSNRIALLLVDLEGFFKVPLKSFISMQIFSHAVFVTNMTLLKFCCTETAVCSSFHLVADVALAFQGCHPNEPKQEVLIYAILDG